MGESTHNFSARTRPAHHVQKNISAPNWLQPRRKKGENHIQTMEGLQDMDSWSSCWWLLVALACLSWYIILYCYHYYHWTYIIIVYYCHLLSFLLMMTRRRRNMPWPSGGLSGRHEGHRGWDKIPSIAMKETCKMVVKIPIENYRCFLRQEQYLLLPIVTTSKAKKKTLLPSPTLR